MKKSLFYTFIAGVLLLAACQPMATQTPTEPVATAPTEMETMPPTELPTEETSEPTEEETAAPTEESAAFEPVIELDIVGEGMAAPVYLDMPNDGSGRLFIVDQVGQIYISDGNGNVLDTPFLDISSNMVSINSNYDERGLLGLAFHPDYANNGRLFIYYSAPLREGGPSGWNHTSVLSEFRVSQADPNIADPDSETIILQIDQPQGNHNSGAITFGPDGYLYIPLGDGGGANDTGSGHAEDWYDANAGGNGQDNEENMLGSILRIDIDNGDPYAVPDDNPPISEAYPEIWAYGFRNPYRMAFDMGGSNQLFLGDAGQNLWEEVSIVEAGGNYGWNVREGAHCFSASEPGNPDAITNCPLEDPEGDPLIDPIIEFPNSSHPDGGLGTTVIGGVVYRGSNLPAWDGRYVFGQWSTGFQSPNGTLFVAAPSTQGMWDFEPIQIESREGGLLNEYVLAFGQDMNGEVYVLTSSSAGPSGDTGRVYRLTSPGDTGMTGESENGESGYPAGAEVDVRMVNFTYQPEEITIQVGTTVTWINDDTIIHDVISGTRDSPTGLIESPDIAAGESFSFTFEEVGTYEYYCSYHAGMSGTVIVTE